MIGSVGERWRNLADAKVLRVRFSPASFALPAPLNALTKKNRQSVANSRASRNPPGRGVWKNLRFLHPLLLR